MMPSNTIQSEQAELRVTAPLELTDSSEDGYTLHGYASRFGAPYEVSDMLGQYTETVRAGAFTRTLNHGADVRLLINHDGLPLARTKSGTLTLGEDADGLTVQARLDPDSPTVQSLKSAMDRGDADQMSIAFRVTRQEWSEDYTQREIIEAQLFDVSVVTFPASPTTSASLRSSAVARWGQDTWAGIERSLRTGEAMNDTAREAFLRALTAAGIDDVTESGSDEQQAAIRAQMRRVRANYALLG